MAVTVTVPVGEPAARGLAVRVGVKVPAVSFPRVMVDGAKATVVVVEAGVTVRLAGGLDAGVKLASPR